MHNQLSRTRLDDLDVDRVIAETPVPSRAVRLAAEFKAVNDDVLELVMHCTEETWRRLCAEEGWSVGVVAHHMASSVPAFKKLVEQMASGEILMSRVSLDRVNEGNARHAREFASVPQNEVLSLLRTHVPETAAVLVGLTEAQLAHTSSVFGGREMSLAQIIEMVVIGHSRQHLASLRATIAE